MTDDSHDAELAATIAERDEARELATAMWVWQTPSDDNARLWNRVGERITKWVTVKRL